MLNTKSWTEHKKLAAIFLYQNFVPVIISSKLERASGSLSKDFGVKMIS